MNNQTIIGRLLAQVKEQPVQLTNMKQVKKELAKPKMEEEEENQFDIKDLCNQIKEERPKKLKVIRDAFRVIIGELEQEYDLTHEL